MPLFLLTALLPGCAPPPAIRRPVDATPPPAAPSPPLWTDAERAACVAFWSRPGRMQVSFAPARAVLTPEASLWFSAFNRALRTASPADAAVWKTWADARFARDRWEASQAAGTTTPGLAPALPGVIPPSLLAAVGNPPPLAVPVVPRRFEINLGGDDGPPLVYVAPIPVSPRYPSFRFAEGVISGGAALGKMAAGELNGLMRAAGLTPFEAHVVGAVSRLEGGFDAVNTYDTGWVSVGFIQFITAEGGNGSLASVLATEKTNRPADFARDFHGRGIDVTAAGTLAVVDPRTGAELTGSEAVRKTIADPRLVSLFQAAGRRSQAFRVAQIQMAKRGYYPANDAIILTLPGGPTLTGKVGDVLQSEAGMATAFDRKVNTGHCAPEVAAAAQQVMAAHALKKLSDVMPYEREVVAILKYRTDFLLDTTLTQPSVPPKTLPPPPP